MIAGSFCRSNRASLITDYATLLYNDEQSVLADAEDPEKVYVTELMPHKLLLYRQYIRDQGFWLDIRILIGTLLKMVGFKPDFLISEIKLRS
jgi:lipopolysaccharide/colanic/teichoic acid biosynthesis glycosyltransferase